MNNFKLFNRYIAKNFLIKFLQVTLGFSVLIFFINILEVLDKVSGSDTPLWPIIEMAFLQIPDFLNDVVPSLVLISAIIAFFSLSSKSEITIIRMSGFSLWQILKPVAFLAFLLGVFWVTIWDPISIQMSKKFNALEAKYVDNEIREVVAPKNGIWLKQSNIEKRGEELIIQAKKVYKQNLELDQVTIWFFNKNGQFYKKIDAETMLMQEDSWLLEDTTINDANSLNKKVKTISIPTDLKADFVMQKIVNNFKNVKLFSIFELPNLITELQSSGFNSTKFKVYFHSLLSKPLLFAAMTLIACYFGLNHIRNKNTILMIFIGIIIGLIFYITSSIMNALGSSGLIPIFASTWVIAIICLASGILLIYRKENF
jgi:lipopolysaccharide export system permease protein